MLDTIASLVAAKVKAVGLVAGTAMVTTALVGGGAVAMSTVSDDRELPDGPPVVQDALLTTETETESDTGTVGIKPDKGPKEPVPTVAFTCDPDKNHGQNVSAFVKSLEKGPGRGEQVSAVAQSDCGKKAGDDEAETADAEEAEVERTDEQKAADKAARAEKKAERKQAVETRKAERNASKGKKG